MDLFEKNYLLLIGLIISILSTAYFYFQLIFLQQYVEPTFSQISIIFLILFAFVYYLFKTANTEKKQVNVSHLLNQIFQYVLVIFLLVLLIKEFYPIDMTINVNYLLIITLFFGIISIVVSKDDKIQKIKEEISKRDIALIVGAGMIGTILVYVKTISLGWLGVFISIIAGLLIIILSYLVLSDDEEEDKD